jgi:hypothetical protein
MNVKTIHRFPRIYHDMEEKIKKVLESGAKTRGEIVKILGVPRTTIYDYLRKMIKKGIVEKKPMNSGKSPRWCMNFNKQACTRPGAKIYSNNNPCSECKMWKPKKGNPPLKGNRGASKVLFSLKESESL